MPIPFRCQQCSATGTAGSRFAGQLIHCPKCQAMVRVPTPAEAAQSVPQPIAVAEDVETLDWPDGPPPPPVAPPLPRLAPEPARPASDASKPDNQPISAAESIISLSFDDLFKFFMMAIPAFIMAVLALCLIVSVGLLFLVAIVSVFMR